MPEAMGFENPEIKFSVANQPHLLKKPKFGQAIGGLRNVTYCQSTLATAGV